jgi:nucleoside-diphosphate-sugar epimerase
MRVLLLGGSGFLSGTMAREAVAAGHQVSTLTRGRRPLPAGVRALIADRRDAAAFAKAIADAGTSWDLVVDCIGFSADDARQDLESFTRDRAAHLVFVSTDSVILPRDRPWRIDETYDRFTTIPYGRGKREAEEVLLAGEGGTMQPPVTILRPGHIYGPGSWLGLLPMHRRDPNLLDRVGNGDPLSLVGGGCFLQQPVFAADLWKMAHSCVGNERTAGRTYFAPGPDTIECREYYRAVADALQVPMPPILEVSISDHLRDHPEDDAACCHRVYSTARAEADGLTLPSTRLRDGIHVHVAWLRSPSSIPR